MKSLAIVILNWNGKHFLEKFLPSVCEFSGTAKIVVADNASTDDSVNFIRRSFPGIQLIINESNGGFSKGYNDALKHVESDYYLLLNSDIEVTPNWTLPLLKTMENPSVAGCQPKVLSYHDKTMFEHAGASGGMLDRNYYPFCRGRIFDKFEHDEGQYNDEVDVFWATGAALLIRAELYHQVGGLDEAFFAHMEEIDLCWRIKKLGYSFKVSPSSAIYHVGGGTLPYLSPKKTYLNFRNSLYMLVKNHDALLFPKLFQRLSLDGIAGIRFMFRGEWKHLASVFHAHIAMYRHLPTLMKQRKEIKKQSKNFNASGLYKGSILWSRYVQKVDHYSDLDQRLFDSK